MAELSLDCTACGKKFRVNFAVKPKQVPCPQCKARVSTSPERPPSSAAAPAGDAAPAQQTAASVASSPTSAAPAAAPTAPATSLAAAPAVAPATAPARAGNGAKPQPKPRRLPPLLKTEELEFKGWARDREAEQARGGLQKADVMGIVWIAGVLLMVGIILHRLAWAPAVAKGIMVLGGLGLVVAGYLFLQLKNKPGGSSCMQCRGPLGFVDTIPAPRECQAGNYLQGASGHAYRLESGQTRKVWEIRRKWHVCKACKRYFIAEKESLDFVGTTPGDMDKREALYAEAAAAGTPPAPAPSPAPAEATPVNSSNVGAA